MYLRAVVAFALSFFAGCAVAPVIAPAHTVSKARFEPPERRVVWGRALEAFQETNTLIAYAESNGGILRSEAQSLTVPCSGGHAGTVCSASALVQFTISDDGVAILRTNRVVTGTVPFSAGRPKPLLAEADVRTLQEQQDALLAWIVRGSAERRAR